MKIIDIETEIKLLIKFKYKEKEHSLVVTLIAKRDHNIIIPAILEHDQAISPDALNEVEMIYTVKDGFYRFANLKMEGITYRGIRAYSIHSDEDVERSNRREAYRVFIGELVTVMVIKEDGNIRNIQGILKNISNTGMGVILKQDFEMGTTMRIIYNFEGLDFFMQGKVVRKDKMRGFRAFHYGCAFKEPNNSLNRVMIQKQIRSKNEKQAKDTVRE